VRQSCRRPWKPAAASLAGRARKICLCGAAAIGLIGCGGPQASVEAARAGAPPVALAPVSADQLRPLSAFESQPSSARGPALFVEASRVLLHPRCVNCHVDGDSPAQGAAFALHEPPVVRGSEDRGVVGMECGGCHQDRNLELSRVPGAPDWRLAPKAMAWVGRTPHELCEQLLDRKRNGDREPRDIVEHVTHDGFVSWGWSPGADRPPAPGSQREFVALVQAWVDSGAACPENTSEAHD
jgi:mono/diheme cytochrome c family protein